tara:strand:- start:188 stop:352 length:165 start_codon:yes stop_codon:yes gene_type:complete
MILYILRLKKQKITFASFAGLIGVLSYAVLKEGSALIVVIAKLLNSKKPRSESI